MASIQTAAAHVDVKLKDVSCTGALIDTPVSPPVGSYVTFRRGGICVTAQVVRVSGTKVGLSFRETINEAELLINIGKSQQTQAPPSKALFPLH